jgi:hypothetical protein
MFHCPESEKAAYHEAIWIPHQSFLGPRTGIEAMVEAIQKVLLNIVSLRDLDQSGDSQAKAIARRPRKLKHLQVNRSSSHSLNHSGEPLCSPVSVMS